MNNRTFWEFWIIDSALRGQDPITRFITGLYNFLWIPFVFLGLACILLDVNFFWCVAMGLKAIWWYWVHTVWYAVTHWDKVVKIARMAVFPGADD